MVFYFSSEFNSVLKINGLYLGNLNGIVKKCNVEILDNAFVEICPLSEKNAPINFIINPALFNETHPYLSIVDLGGAYLLTAQNRPTFTEKKVLCEKNYPLLNAVAFVEKGFCIQLSTPNDSVLDTFCEFPTSVSFNPFSLNNLALLAVIASGKNKVVYVYSIGEKIRFLKKMLVSNCSFENGFTTTEKFMDHKKHTRKTNWCIKNGELVRESVSVSNEKDVEIAYVIDNLIPYLFLEEFIVGGNFNEFLADNVKNNSDKLKGYFGEFIGVIPPPSFREWQEIGLVKRLRENFYSVDYYTFEVENKKITNVKKS